MNWVNEMQSNPKIVQHDEKSFWKKNPVHFAEFKKEKKMTYILGYVIAPRVIYKALDLMHLHS